MTLLLFFQPFLKGLDQFLQSTHRLNLGFVFLRQHALKFGTQPVIRNQCFEQVIHTLQPLEVGTEGTVKLVVVLFVFNQAGPRKEIKLVHIGEHNTALECLQEIEKLPERRLHLGAAQGFKKPISMACPPVRNGDAT